MLAYVANLYVNQMQVKPRVVKAWYTKENVFNMVTIQ